MAEKPALVGDGDTAASVSPELSADRVGSAGIIVAFPTLLEYGDYEVICCARCYGFAVPTSENCCRYGLASGESSPASSDGGPDDGPTLRVRDYRYISVHEERSQRCSLVSCQIVGS